MEVCLCGDELAILMEEAAALGQECIHVADGFKVLVDHRFVDERPEVFGGLQLRCVGRQVNEPQPVRYGEAWFGVPCQSRSKVCSSLPIA